MAEGRRYVPLGDEQLLQGHRSFASNARDHDPSHGGSGKKVLPLATMAVTEDTRVVVLVDDDRAGSDTVALLERELQGPCPDCPDSRRRSTARPGAGRPLHAR